MKISEEFINYYIKMLIDSIEYLDETENTIMYFAILDKIIENYKKDFMNQLRNIRYGEEFPCLINTFSKRYIDYFIKRNMLDRKSKENDFNSKEEHESPIMNNFIMIPKKRKKVEETKKKEKIKFFDTKENKIYDEVTNFTSFYKNNLNSLNLFTLTNEDRNNENQNSKLVESFENKSMNSDLYLTNTKLELDENQFHQNNSNQNSPLYYYTEQSGYTKFNTNLVFHGKQNNTNIQNNQLILNNQKNTKNLIQSKEYCFYNFEKEKPIINITSINPSTEDKVANPVQIDNIYINQSSTTTKHEFQCFNFCDIIKEFQKNLSKKLKVFMEFVNDQFKTTILYFKNEDIEIRREKLKDYLLYKIIAEKKANFLTFEVKYKIEELLKSGNIFISTLPRTSEFVKFIKANPH
jgi:hypothetical protein